MAQVEISDSAAAAGVSATFTYSVHWMPTDVTYDKRMDKYRRYQFLPQHLEACSPLLLIFSLCTSDFPMSEDRLYGVRTCIL